MPALRGLYAITDARLTCADTPDRVFFDAIRAALLGGARLLQYRDKSDDAGKRLHHALTMRQLCSAFDALLIINDDVELALHSHAHGVHLGQHDADIASAREALGESAIIGASCYDRFELAEQARAAGADYIAFGAFFASPTKPDAATAGVELLHRARAELDLPVCAIGGITPANAAPLVTAGADMLAVISAVFSADDIEHRASQFTRLFG